jgi:hypothetical protein
LYCGREKVLVCEAWYPCYANPIALRRFQSLF